VDATIRVAQAAAALIEDQTFEAGGLTAVASRLDITDRHLRRAFGAEFGVSPVQFAQTQRLLLAKRLLTDTDLSVTEIAFASGFGSLRRFNVLFKQRYRLQPGQLRRHINGEAIPLADTLNFELTFRPPYDWPAMCTFLGARALAGVEAIAGASYRRTVHVTAADKEYLGWIEVGLSPNKPALRVAVSASLARVLSPVLARVKALMDLSCNPAEVAKALCKLAEGRPGIRVPGAFDGFEIAVRAIIGQQVTVAAARTVAGRFASSLGDPVDTPFDALTTVFPTAARVADTPVGLIAGLGMPAVRARAVVALARSVANGSLLLMPNSNIEATLERLRALPGVGEWTAQYIAMRVLAWPDAFLHTDHGVMKALDEKHAHRVFEAAEIWRPWRAYAVMHLWNSLTQE
jgi:AraC family transcriptional regulator of adaptative response / DNA-3-methyladenine glycosylase II